jgi:hypothetical protein
MSIVCSEWCILAQPGLGLGRPMSARGVGVSVLTLGEGRTD